MIFTNILVTVVLSLQTNTVEHWPMAGVWSNTVSWPIRDDTNADTKTIETTVTAHQILQVDIGGPVFGVQTNEFVTSNPESKIVHRRVKVTRTILDYEEQSHIGGVSFWTNNYLLDAERARTNFALRISLLPSHPYFYENFGHYGPHQTINLELTNTVKMHYSVDMQRVSTNSWVKLWSGDDIETWKTLHDFAELVKLDVFGINSLTSPRYTLAKMCPTNYFVPVRTKYIPIGPFQTETNGLSYYIIGDKIRYNLVPVPILNGQVDTNFWSLEEK